MLAIVGADRAWCLAHIDGGELLLRVDPEISAGIAGPHELAGRARHAGDAAGRPYRKAEAERISGCAEQELARTERRGNAGAEMVCRHQRDGRARQDARAVELPAV